MDLSNLNTRVLLKEPRGVIRILQIVFCIIAWSATTGFSTITQLVINCADNTTFTLDYKVEYPFDFQEIEVVTPYKCNNETEITQTFPIDFSSTAMFFVLNCVLSMINALGCIIFYTVYHIKYASNPLLPIVDLCATLFFTIMWFSMALAWALNVSDLKHYTHPNYIKDFLSACDDENANCSPASPGKWSSLTISIVAAFTSVILWAGSLWFVFKETSLHNKDPSTMPGYGPSSTVGQQQRNEYQAQPSTSSVTGANVQYSSY